MPKPKPDQVIRHEIVLGSVERNVLRDAQTAYSVNRLASPFTNLSPAGAVAFGGVIVLFIEYLLNQMGLDKDLLDITKDMTPDEIKDWLETQNLVGAGIGGLFGGLIAGPFGAAIGAVTGSAAVEVGEHQQDVFGQMGVESAVEVGIAGSLISIWNALGTVATGE